MWIQEIGFNLLKCTFKQCHIRMRAVVTLQPCAFHHITPILDDIQCNGITLSVTLLIYNFTLANLQWSKSSADCTGEFSLCRAGQQKCSRVLGEVAEQEKLRIPMSCQLSVLCQILSRTSEWIVKNDCESVVLWWKNYIVLFWKRKHLMKCEIFSLVLCKHFSSH